MEHFSRWKEMYTCCVMLLNNFCSVSNRNSLNLSTKPLNNTSPKNHFCTSTCLIWTFLFEGFNVDIYFECLHTGHLLIYWLILAETHEFLPTINKKTVYVVVPVLCLLGFLIQPMRCLIFGAACTTHFHHKFTYWLEYTETLLFSPSEHLQIIKCLPLFWIHFVIYILNVIRGKKKVKYKWHFLYISE